MPKTSAKAAARTSEEAASYTLAHRTRIAILSALYESEHSASELSRLLRISLSTVTHHLTEMLASGVIKVAEIREAGNVEQKIYSMAMMPFDFMDEAEWEELTFEKRQALLALVVMTSTALAMNSLWSGAISNEPKSWMVSDSVQLDQQGWQDVCAVFQRAWDQLNTIAAESDDRRATTGEEARPYVYNLQTFPRTSISREQP